MNDKKLHAIYLESQDEITAVIDQLRSCPDDTIALVAGQRIGILQSLVNLKLLLKNGQAVNKQILLITTDPVALSLAKQLDIPVFSKLDHAQKFLRGEKFEISPDTVQAKTFSGAQQPGDQKTATYGMEQKAKGILSSLPFGKKDKTDSDIQTISFQNRPLLIGAALFGLLPVLLGIYAALTILPYARISIVPATEEFTQDFEIKAAESITELNYLAKEIPAYFYETRSEISKTAPATKLIDIGTKATGTVTIYNKHSSNPISFAAGTVITSYDGKTFHLKNDTKVPALVYDAGVIYQGIKSQVQVEAGEVGEEYNISKTDFSISGYEDSSSLLWAESNEDFTGGEKHEAIVVGQEDIDSLRTQILTELSAKNEETLIASAGAGQISIEGSILHQIVEETNTAELEQEAQEFTLTVKLESKGLLFPESALDEIITRTMSLSIPTGFEPLTDQSWQSSYEVDQLDMDTRTIRFTGHGKGLIAKRISTADLKSRLKGLNREQADIILSRYDDTIQKYDINIGPFWVKSIPSNIEKITIDKLSAEQFASLTQQ